MDRTPMSSTHDRSTGAAPWAWQLDGTRRARRLPAAPMPRWLAVERGAVWLTRSENQAARSEDVWLRPGERQLLPAGSDWVAEGWPTAEVVVLEAPTA